MKFSLLLRSAVKHQTHHFHTHPGSSSTNTLLKDYVKTKATQKALLLFRNLWSKKNKAIDSFSLLFVLKSCTIRSSAGTAMGEGKQFHGLIVNLGFQNIIFLQSAMINMYSAYGSLDDAQQMFDEIVAKNVVCWTSLISAYVDNGKPSKALKLFRQMQMETVEPDQVTVTVALSACADLGALEMGEWTHTYVRRQGFDIDLSLNNALINMYAKCGNVKMARRIFDRIKVKDVTTWTSMIVGHAVHGQAVEALELFREMTAADDSNSKKSVIRPNDITFVGVLIACSRGGLVEQGLYHFQSMRNKYKLKPRISHCGCIVDLLCRAGFVQKAYDFVIDMPIKPNAVIWRTLLGACSLQHNTKLAENARHRLLELEPDYAGDDVTISNTYAAAGMWDEKMTARDRVKQRRIPGCSSIEVDCEVHEFVVQDKKHPKCNAIYEILECMMKNMKNHGYGHA